MENWPVSQPSFLPMFTILGDLEKNTASRVWLAKEVSVRVSKSLLYPAPHHTGPLFQTFAHSSVGTIY